MAQIIDSIKLFLLVVGAIHTVSHIRQAIRSITHRLLGEDRRAGRVEDLRSLALVHQSEQAFAASLERIEEVGADEFELRGEQTILKFDAQKPLDAQERDRLRYLSVVGLMHVVHTLRERQIEREAEA